MRTFIIILLLIVCTPSVHAQEVQKLVNRKSMCSAVFISRNKLLTANHCIIKIAPRIKIRGKAYKAKILKQDKKADLALLSIRYRSQSYYQIGDMPETGTRVELEGFRFGRRRKTTGTYTTPTNTGYSLIYQPLIAQEKGSSGGAVIYKNKLIGIISSGSHNCDIASSAQTIKKFLKNLL